MLNFFFNYHSNIFFGWIAGIFLSLICGPLGSFMIWRRMSAFGNTLSHASLLGLSLSFLLHTNIFLTVLFFLIFLTILIAYIENFSTLSLDTIFAVMTYGSLSLGMIILHIIKKNEQSNLTKYLFGDLLKLNVCDLFSIIAISIITILIIIIYWDDMIGMIINAEIAKISGINILKMRLILMLLTAILIAISTKLIGALLITALLIIPPAITQKFASSPEMMVFFSIIINFTFITLGIMISIFYNIPISPLIICLESILFFISIII
ncbi:iron chelate uptake ABC transporter family permease subunit [Buchnera aphidicola]|uniref:iron chelate uptake ABC transporter family permease subunit n=1 Tax=Buchnera aphidicola TaxID=9 RepID=UPI0031B7FC71